VQFRVLGPVEIHTDDGRRLTLPRRQERCLLAILLLDAGRAVRMDRLCELLWDDNPPGHARQAVRTYVARIRSVLAQAGAPEHGIALLAAHGGYLLKVSLELIDAHRFRSLLDGAAHTADPARRDQLLRTALELWRGPALDKAATDRLRHRLCADLDELRLHATEESIAAGLELDHHRDILPELARLGAEHPIRERLIELHMIALHRDGRTTEALDVYARARTRLVEEFGLDPSPALQHLQQAMLRGEPAAVPSAKLAQRPGSSHVTPAHLPADIPAFAGRAGHIHSLDNLLTDAGKGAAVIISALAGTAGVGKTALAVHWAHRVRHCFPDGQLYINLRGFDPTGAPVRPEEAIRRFLDALSVPTQRIPTDFDAQIDLYRSLLADKRVLIVLDNARDSDQVRPLLPGTSGCLALVTSRKRLTGLVAIDGAHPLVLDLLTTDEARHLLTARLGQGRVAAEPEALDDLIQLCARLPLALAICAAHAATQPDLPLSDLTAQLRTVQGSLDALTGDDTATNIRAVFACSYQTLKPDTARLFRLLGLHPGPDMSAAAAASLAGISPDLAGSLIAELVNAHLVTEPISGRYSLHDLLRAYASEQAYTFDSESDRRAATHRLLDYYLHTAYAAALHLRPHRDRIALAPVQPGVTVEELGGLTHALAWFTAEHLTLLAAIRQAASTGFDIQTWQLAWTLSDFLDRRGHWQDWASVQDAALHAACRLADNAGQATAHSSLAGAYTRLGRYDEAHIHLTRALDLFTSLGDPTGQARTHRNLGRLFEWQGLFKSALNHSQQALNLYRAIGDQHGEARTLNGVGWYHSRLGNHRQGAVFCQQALVLLQQLDDREGQAATWDSLGYIYHQLGHHHQAATCYQQAINLDRELGERYHEAVAQTRLGDLHSTAGNPTAAAAAWHEALAILDQLHHTDADTIRTKLDNLEMARST
jgi:DNA-binding SARP family transcriptional activator/tetratricopeptide (TPR) repeat protein